MWNFYEWMFRLSALLIMPIVLIDMEMYFFIQMLMFLHINMGLTTMVNDYVHVKKMSLIFFSLMRILIIEMLSCSLELLL